MVRGMFEDQRVRGLLGDASLIRPGSAVAALAGTARAELADPWRGIARSALKHEEWRRGLLGDSSRVRPGSAVAVLGERVRGEHSYRSVVQRRHRNVDPYGVAGLARSALRDQDRMRGLLGDASFIRPGSAVAALAGAARAELADPWRGIARSALRDQDRMRGLLGARAELAHPWSVHAVAGLARSVFEDRDRMKSVVTAFDASAGARVVAIDTLIDPLVSASMGVRHCNDEVVGGTIARHAPQTPTRVSGTVPADALREPSLLPGVEQQRPAVENSAGVESEMLAAIHELVLLTRERNAGERRDFWIFVVLGVLSFLGYDRTMYLIQVLAHAMRQANSGLYLP